MGGGTWYAASTWCFLLSSVGLASATSKRDWVTGSNPSSKQASTIYRLQTVLSTFQNKKYSNFCLVGRTLDVTEGKIGSLQQTAEEVMTTFCNVIFLQHTKAESDNIVFLYIQNISNLNTWRFPFPSQFHDINKLFVLADIQIQGD